MGKALSAQQQICPLHLACLYFSLMCRLQTYMLKAACLFSVSVSGKHFFKNTYPTDLIFLIQP